MASLRPTPPLSAAPRRCLARSLRWVALGSWRRQCSMLVARSRLLPVALGSPRMRCSVSVAWSRRMPAALGSPRKRCLLLAPRLPPVPTSRRVSCLAPWLARWWLALGLQLLAVRRQRAARCSGPELRLRAQGRLPLTAALRRAGPSRDSLPLLAARPLRVQGSRRLLAMSLRSAAAPPLSPCSPPPAAHLQLRRGQPLPAAGQHFPPRPLAGRLRSLLLPGRGLRAAPGARGGRCAARQSLRAGRLRRSGSVARRPGSRRFRSAPPAQA